jgi:hypothetical protein
MLHTRRCINEVEIPPTSTPGGELWHEEIWKHRCSLSEEERTDPTWRASYNDAWWVQFFKAWQDVEM